jgi:hypothetical protein
MRVPHIFGHVSPFQIVFGLSTSGVALALMHCGPGGHVWRCGMTCCVVWCAGTVSATHNVTSAWCWASHVSLISCQELLSAGGGIDSLKLTHGILNCAKVCLKLVAGQTHGCFKAVVDCVTARLAVPEGLVCLRHWYLYRGVICQGVTHWSLMHLYG